MWGRGIQERGGPMDLRVLVLIADPDLGQLVRAQVDNLGCSCVVAPTYDAASNSFGWADAAIVDLESDGLDDLYRLRVEAPTVRTIAIAPDADRAASAQSAGVGQVLVEPFSIADIVDAVKALRPITDAAIVDLRTGLSTPAPAVDDAPWWATR
jgi:DNA-binding response OmpR family regulator